MDGMGVCEKDRSEGLVPRLDPAGSEPRLSSEAGTAGAAEGWKLLSLTGSSSFSSISVLI